MPELATDTNTLGHKLQAWGTCTARSRSPMCWGIAHVAQVIVSTREVQSQDSQLQSLRSVTGLSQYYTNNQVNTR